MTARDLWLSYIDSLDGDDRHDAISEFYRLCATCECVHHTDAAEYILFMRTGKVAPMPDMSIWA